jgi:dTDP-4-amino-4,6-dideoxygalactose transaminase
MTAVSRERGVPFVDLHAQYTSIAHEVAAAMEETLDRGDFILGAGVDDFEHAFAGYCETSFGVGVDSGTSALELALRAFDIGPGDEVITAANSFIASALAITHAGATPVLVDVDPSTYTIDPVLVEKSITDRTRAIMPVHLYGHAADMDRIMEIARAHDLVVVEDASQAHGARYKGRRVGSIGDAAAFSLYPAKNLGAYGDAGIVVTNIGDIDERIRLLRNYGSSEKYRHDSPGFNRRLDTMQARVLNVKLRHLDSWNAARRRHAARYGQLLSGSDGIVRAPTTSPDVESVFHLYVVQVDERDRVRAELADRQISTVIHYPIPIHLQGAYSHLGYSAGDFPVTESAAHRVLSLPMYPELGEADIARVVDALLESAARP